MPQLGPKAELERRRAVFAFTSKTGIHRQADDVRQVTGEPVVTNSRVFLLHARLRVQIVEWI